MKKIWIIILNWNWIDDTVECIESLVQNSYKDIDIILVDNNSKNQEWEKLKTKYKWLITFIQNQENLWFSWWCNVWISKSVELWNTHIMLFNNDAVAKDGFIEKLLDSLEQDSSIWIVWPAITYYKSDEIWFAWWKINYLIWSPCHNLKWKNISTLEWSDSYETEYVSWCCILIKKEVVESIGMLDEQYFAYNEEVDFCFRARKKWYKCFIIANSSIEHKKSASAWNKWSNHLSEIQAYLMARNWVYFWKKNLKWIKKYWFLFAQYSILPLLRLIFQIRKIGVLKAYFRWLFNKRCEKINL